MPWQKSFDSDAALQKAMEAFWARGYEATSMQDLVDCMGLGRGSLYATFGGKRSLFVQALRRYDERHRRDWTARWRRGDGEAARTGLAWGGSASRPSRRAPPFP